MNNFKVLMNGIVKENPTFVLLLGMCPTLGTTSSAINGMGMGLATMFVLICSNVVMSLIKNLIPDTHSVIHCGNRVFCDFASDGDAGLCPWIVCYIRAFYSVDCCELYCIGTCRSICS